MVFQYSPFVKGDNTVSFDLMYAIEKFPILLKYSYMTIILSVISMIISIIISIIITLLRYYRVKGVQKIISFYIDFFRGTPLVTQLFFLYYGLAQLIPAFRNMSGFTAAIIGLSLNASAYMAENMRAAIESVDYGQTEAGYSVGMKRLQIMRYIVLPQAAKVAIPTLTNDFIGLIKSSSMAFVLGVRDIMAQTALVGASSYRYFECYFDAIIIYFIITKVVSFIQKKIEKAMNKNKR